LLAKYDDKNKSNIVRPIDLIWKTPPTRRENTMGAGQQNFTILEERLQNCTLILSHLVKISWCELTRDGLRGSPNYIYD
jgi:hypothetical protein